MEYLFSSFLFNQSCVGNFNLSCVKFLDWSMIFVNPSGYSKMSGHNMESVFTHSIFKINNSICV